MFFADFCIYLTRKFRTKSYTLSFLKKSFFKQVLNFQIVFHLNKLKYCQFTIFISNLKENGFLFNLNLKYLRIRGIEKGELVVKIVDLNFVDSLLPLNLNDVIAKKLDDFLFPFQWVVIFFVLFCFLEAFDTMLFLLRTKIKHNLSFWIAIYSTNSERMCFIIICDGTDDDAGDVFFVDSFINKNTINTCDVH